MTGKVINLRQRRKQVERATRAKRAAENAAKFGHSKADKLLESDQKSRVEKILDGHKVEPDDEENESEPNE